MAAIGHDTVVINLQTINKDNALYDADSLTVIATSPMHPYTDIGVDATGPILLTSVQTDLSFLIAGDELDIEGFTNTENNGRYVVAANGTRFSVEVTKEDAQAVVSEAAGNEIKMQVESAFVYDGIDPVIIKEPGTGLYTAYIPTTSSGRWQFEIIAIEDLGSGRDVKTRKQLSRELKVNTQELVP